MTNNILISSATKKQLDMVIKNEPQSLLLEGPKGIGKYTLAIYLIKEVLKVKDASSIQYFEYVEQINGTIKIDQIRELISHLKLKTTGSRSKRRAVLIRNAEYMNHESQNAFLKMLEEPPDDTFIVLTVANKHKLASTILSRVQLVRVIRPKEDEVLKYFTNHESNKVKQAYNLSGGSIGMIDSMLNKSEEYKLLETVNQVKVFITLSKTEKLKAINDISNREDLKDDWIFALKRIASAALHNAVKSANQKSISFWINALNSIENFETSLDNGGNTKLSLTNLVLNM